MIRATVFIGLFCLLTSSSGQKSEKRGLAYGYHSQADMMKLQEGISWWYNWYHLPDAALRSSFQELDVAFVPMAWNGEFDKEGMRSFLQANPQINYLLGFNEPNFTDQANMTPSHAAAAWPDLEQLGDEFDLKLIGPAVNYCGDCVSENGIIYSDPIDYLDAFFEACTNCRVDYLAVHWYGCGGLDWYLEQFSKYHLPIWVTEIACWDQSNITLDQQKSFLINAVDQMETNPMVEKYAWFTGRGDGPHISLLGSDGVLTDLGKLYINMPVHDADYYASVPAKIEAEVYQRMSGVQLELSSDGVDEINVGYLDPGDWLEYNLEIETSDVYLFDLRYAASRQGKLGVSIDDVGVLDVFLPSTGDWQTWDNLKWELELPQGKHTIRLMVLIDGVNLNWFKIDYKKNLLNIPKDKLSIFPNPVDELLSIPVEDAHISYQLIITDLNNQIILKNTNLFGDQLQRIPVGHLGEGLYFVHLLYDDGQAQIARFLVRH